MLLGNSKEPGTCTRAGQLSAGRLWHDFPNLLSSVKEDAISVNTQGKLRDAHSGPSTSYSCFECLTTLQSVSAASGLAHRYRWQ